MLKGKISQSDLDQRLKDWEERMRIKEEKEQQDEQEKADRMRQHYLDRTGRKEMKP